MSYIDNSDTTVSNSYSFICTMSFKWTFWKVFLDYFDNSLKKSFSSLYFWLSFLWRYKVLWYFVQLYWIYFRLLRVLSQANISLYIKFFIFVLFCKWVLFIRENCSGCLSQDSFGLLTMKLYVISSLYWIESIWIKLLRFP